MVFPVPRIRRLFGVAACILLVCQGVSANEGRSPQLSAIAAVTSDYVYRGLSLRDEKPSALIFVEARHGPFYVNGQLIGTYLGEDALGRSIGSIEADATAGALITLGRVDINVGTKYTGYPNGRDIIVGTLVRAERDFVEPFAGATVNLSDGVSVGATVYWTPDFYYETGSVVTTELRGGLALPVWGKLQSKLVATAGWVESAREGAVSPGSGYTYYNAGIEGRVERFLFDVKYWDTDVNGIDGFEQRATFSVGVAFE